MRWLQDFMQTLRNIFVIPALRTKILWTAFFLIIYRLGSHVPIPGIKMDVLQTLLNTQEVPGGLWGGALVMFSTLTAGALGNCAVFSLGIMPYISASIIFSLLVKVLPSLEEIAKEGASGQRKINEYTRYATVPLCLLQAWMIVTLFKRPISLGENQVEYLFDTSMGVWFDISAVLTLTVGALFLMWIGEQITEYGMGNGISLLIMAGIVGNMPMQVRFIISSGQGEEIKKLLVLIALFFVVIGSVVYMTYGQRRITIQQQKRTQGRRVYGGIRHTMPLKVNQAGVMPVIFASSVLIFPMTIFSLIGNSDSFAFESGSFWYISSYIVLVYFFSYFWTSLMFQPREMAKNLQEHGTFIPGMRPGKITADYLEQTMIRITFVGAAFLSLIALMPQFVSMSLNIKGATRYFVYNLGGTSILIVVGVVLELIQRLDSYLLESHYDGFIKKQ